MHETVVDQDNKDDVIMIISWNIHILESCPINYCQVTKLRFQGKHDSISQRGNALSGLIFRCLNPFNWRSGLNRFSNFDSKIRINSEIISKLQTVTDCLNSGTIRDDRPQALHIWLAYRNKKLSSARQTSERRTTQLICEDLKTNGSGKFKIPLLFLILEMCTFIKCQKIL